MESSNAGFWQLRSRAPAALFVTYAWLRLGCTRLGWALGDGIEFAGEYRLYDRCCFGVIASLAQH
jgi:hypothetical protein